MGKGWRESVCCVLAKAMSIDDAGEVCSEKVSIKWETTGHKFRLLLVQAAN